MNDRSDWIPLFTLNTVLFPDGILPLKVFEPRYLDMVRDCMKERIPFGVVLIRAGQEIGIAADPETVGCLAHIIDWDAQQLGVLLLRTQGGRRFRIIETRIRPNKLLEARIDLMPADESLRIMERHAACARTLGLIIEDINMRGRDELGEDFESPFPDRLKLEDAGWVANRWSEILPIPLKARQRLLELQDVPARLAIVHEYLLQHHIL